MSVPRLRLPLRAVRRSGAVAALAVALLALAVTLFETATEPSVEQEPRAGADDEQRSRAERAAARRAARRAERAERALAAAREDSEPQPASSPVEAPAPQQTASPPSSGATAAPQRESFSFEG